MASGPSPRDWPEQVSRAAYADTSSGSEHLKTQPSALRSMSMSGALTTSWHPSEEYININNKYVVIIYYHRCHAFDMLFYWGSFLHCDFEIRLRKRTTGFQSFAPWISSEPAIWPGSCSHGLVIHIWDHVEYSGDGNIDEYFVASSFSNPVQLRTGWWFEPLWKILAT